MEHFLHINPSITKEPGISRIFQYLRDISTLSGASFERICVMYYRKSHALFYSVWILILFFMLLKQTFLRNKIYDFKKKERYHWKEQLFRVLLVRLDWNFFFVLYVIACFYNLAEFISLNVLEDLLLYLIYRFFLGF